MGALAAASSLPSRLGDSFARIVPYGIMLGHKPAEEVLEPAGNPVVRHQPDTHTRSRSQTSNHRPMVVGHLWKAHAHCICAVAQLSPAGFQVGIRIHQDSDAVVATFESHRKSAEQFLKAARIGNVGASDALIIPIESVAGHELDDRMNIV